MFKIATIVFLPGLLLVSACGQTDFERGASGAAAGVVAAELLDEDPVTGAVLGGAAGVFSDDLQRR